MKLAFILVFTFNISSFAAVCAAGEDPFEAMIEKIAKAAGQSDAPATPGHVLGEVTLTWRGKIMRVNGRGRYPPVVHPPDNLNALDGNAWAKFSGAGGNSVKEQEVLNQIFNKERSAALSKTAGKTNLGEDIDFYRAVSQQELEDLMKNGRMRPQTLIKDRVKNFTRDEATLNMYADDFAEEWGVGIDRAKALMKMNADERLQALAQEKGWEWVMRQHKSHTSDSLFKGASVGPHFSADADGQYQYVIIIRDTRNRAVRNPFNTFEDEWLFLNGVHSDEVVEVMNVQEYRQRMGFTGQLFHDSEVETQIQNLRQSR